MTAPAATSRYVEPRNEPRAESERWARGAATDTAWACGLSPDQTAQAGERCRDIVPELIVELI